MMDLRPEDELLLCCARTDLRGRPAERAKALLRMPMDWFHIKALALRHRLIPLLYRNLKELDHQAVPQPVLLNFRKNFVATAGHTLRLTSELLRVLRLLEDHEIPAIPYKGPVLAISLYGEVPLRPFCDLDILVRRRDIVRAKRLLLSRGYQPFYQLTETQEKIFVRSDSGGPFIRSDDTATVEIEWEITPREFPVPLNAEYFWSRLGWTSIEGMQVRTFSPEDLLLLLCVHGAKHQWEQLNWICDLAEFIRVHGEIRWEETVHRAAALGCRRILFLGLFLAHTVLEAPLPGPVLKSLPHDDAMISVALPLWHRLFRESVNSPPAFALSKFYLQVSDRLRDRAAYCMRLAFTPTVRDWRSLPLPRMMAFLYYLVHPVSLCARYGFQLLTRARSI